MIIQCCVCHRIKRDGAWRDVSRPDVANAALCTHTYCPDCLKQQMLDIEECAARIRPARCPPLAAASTGDRTR